MKIVHTNGKDIRFVDLCSELDEFLDKTIGKEKQQSEYNEFNKLDDINDVILVINDDIIAGCGGFKKYNDTTAEVKRVFVKECERRKGIAEKIMSEIENAAAEHGYTSLILETGDLLKGAQNLYKKCGFHIIENFGQYIGKNTSVCMKKDISNNALIYKLLYNLETELLKPEVRKSAERINEILSNDYIEYCSSGFIYKYKNGDTFYEEGVTFNPSEFKCNKLSDNCYLVNYTVEKNYNDDRHSKISLRSSIWKNYNGKWKLYFHQGTTKVD